MCYFQGTAVCARFQQDTTLADKKVPHICSVRHVHRTQTRVQQGGCGFPLVVDGVLGVSQVENDRAVGPGTTAILKDALKVNGAVEVERAIVVDIYPVRLVVTGGVEDGDLHSRVSTFFLFSLCGPRTIFK